jgi:enamine deaminase RidA (YjgF/YER057c/UK114 family)
MEKPQAGDTRFRRRSERGLDPATALELRYFGPAEFDAHQAAFGGRTMGAVAFGAHRPPVTAPGFPYAWVDMPVLNGQTVFEVWTSAQPVVRENAAGIESSRNDDILFGCLQMDAGDNLDAASYLAYSRIFDFIDRRDYAHLLRVWHYIPQINVIADGVERYLSFNAGRHEAFAAKGRVIGENTPAACALGSRGGVLTVYFIAAKRSGQVVENPRQTSAYRYPPEYGLRSPTFSRAMLMQTGGNPLLFISGTASIVGHETQHVGDAAAQARETVANILAVIAEAELAGLDPSNSAGNLLLKVYLRHADYIPVVQERLAHAFGSAVNVLYLQADICRSNLLLEVEAVYLNAPRRMH